MWPFFFPCARLSSTLSCLTKTLIPSSELRWDRHRGSKGRLNGEGGCYLLRFPFRGKQKTFGECTKAGTLYLASLPPGAKAPSGFELNKKPFNSAFMTHPPSKSLSNVFHFEKKVQPGDLSHQNTMRLRPRMHCMHSLTAFCFHRLSALPPSFFCERTGFGFSHFAIAK